MIFLSLLVGVSASVWELRSYGALGVGPKVMPKDDSELRGLAATVGSYVTYVSLRDTGVTNLDPLRRLTGLVRLEIENAVSNTAVMDLSPLSGLNRLRSLTVSRGRMETIESLRALTGLTHLSFTHSETLTDFSPIAGMTKLATMTLMTTQVSDLSFLKELRSLESVDLSYTRVTDLKPLKKLKRLRELRLRFTPVTDLAPLKDLKDLGKLDLIGSRITAFPDWAKKWKDTYIHVRFQNEVTGAESFGVVDKNTHLYHLLPRGSTDALYFGDVKIQRSADELGAIPGDSFALGSDITILVVSSGGPSQGGGGHLAIAISLAVVLVSGIGLGIYFYVRT